MSKTSSEWLPEFFVDRNLGKQTVDRMRADGWILHTLSEHYPNDAQHIDDMQWIAEGCRRGWVLLTKDKRIRYRAAEIGELAPDAFLFALTRGDLTIDEMVTTFTRARPAIGRAARQGEPGFYHISRDGRVTRMGP